MGTTKYNFGSRAGLSIVEVIAASALAAGLSLVLATMSKQVSIGNVRVSNEATLVAIRNQIAASSSDPEAWMRILKSSNAELKACFRTAGATCPAAASTAVIAADPVLIAESTAKTISTTDLYDLNGIRFAGKADSGTNGVYYDAMGLPCVSASPNTDKACRYRSTGWIIRQNASGSPGRVVLVRKIEQTTGSITKESPAMAPIFERVNLGTMWATTNLNGPEVGTVLPFTGDFADTGVPHGFLPADGRSLSTTDHPQLFARIGYTWGGSGTTFRLPDFRGQFIRGTTSSALVASTETSALATHAHQVGVTVGGWFQFSSVAMTASGSGSSVTGKSPWFNPGSVFDGKAGYGVCSESLTVHAMGTSSIPVTVTGASNTNVSVTGMSGVTTAVSTTAGVAGETRPTNAAINYLVRDDYE